MAACGTGSAPPARHGGQPSLRPPQNGHPGSGAGSEPSSSSEPGGGRSRSAPKRKGLNPVTSSPPLCPQAQTSPF